MVTSFLKLVRWPNLLIVFITQSIVWFHLICNSLEAKNLSSNLSILQFLLLSLCTIIVAGAGYIINDIEDLKIDLINKPNKVIVGKTIMANTCRQLYYTLLIIGLLIALGLALNLGNLPYVVLFPLSAGLLHLYATYFKKTALIGNVLISIFVAAVPLIIFLADIDQFSYSLDKRIYHILGLYSCLAFLANLAREIVKDMQDIKGDRIFGGQTFPIQFGLTATKMLTYIVLIFLIIVLGCWAFYLDSHMQTEISKYVGAFPLMLLSFILIVTLAKMKDRSEFGKWSLGIKLFMLYGLIFLYLQPL